MCGGGGGGSSLSDALATGPHPQPWLSTARLKRCQRKVLPTTHPSTQSSLLLDGNRVSARGGNRAERHRQVPQVALSANLPQRSLGLLINPRPTSLPGPTPSFRPRSQHFRLLHTVQAREFPQRRRYARFFPAGPQDDRKRRGDALAGTREQGGRARTVEVRLSVMRGSGECRQKDSPPPPPATGSKLWRAVGALGGCLLLVL